MPDLTLQAFQPQSVTVVQNGAAPQAQAGAEKKGGFSFGDFIDMINPLHHIPVVGQVYRALTGDQISDTARMAGGGLFAGPLGIGIAAATISMRGDNAEGNLVGAQGTASTQPAIQQTPSLQDPALQNGGPEKRGPGQPALGVPIGQTMEQYEAISQRYWTQSNLNALANAMSLKVPDGPPKASDKESTPERLPTQPVAKVSQAKPLAGPSGDSAVYAQMLANLEKLEALDTQPR